MVVSRSVTPGPSSFNGGSVPSGSSCHSARPLRSGRGRAVRDLEMERLERQIGALEELGLRGRRGVKIFPSSPQSQSIVGQVVFGAGDGDVHEQCAEKDRRFDGEYKCMYRKAAGRPSWVEQDNAVRTYPETLGAVTSHVDLEGEDEDDLAKKRGVKRFNHFDRKSTVFDEVVLGGTLAAASSVGSGEARESPAAEKPQEYTLLYTGAAGTPSWAQPAPRTKGSMSKRLRHQTVQISRRFLARITQDWKIGVPAVYQEDGSLVQRSSAPPAWGVTPSTQPTPRTPREIGPPAGCGMARLARKRRGMKAANPWYPH